MNNEQTTDHAEAACGKPSAEPRSLHDQKRAIRREKLALRRAMSPDLRPEADAAINRRLLEIVRTERPPALVAYVSDGTEPDLAPVMRDALQTCITLCLPRFGQDGSYSIVIVHSLDFPVSHWGIPEPSADAPAASPDVLAKALWLVPGVAFDSACRRLGRGKGVYDRLLARCAGKTIGIFYELQRCDSLPCEPTDQPVGRIVTESGVFGCTNNVRS
jgi:5-formyltetrahydrofolate cyclo-ligase